ncbi:MAG: SAM-dependent chlorinase/fluorinase [archaeon]
MKNGDYLKLKKLWSLLKMPRTNNVVVITDCKDSAFNELRRAILSEAERIGNHSLNVEPVVPAKEFSITNASFLTRLMAEAYPPNTSYLVIMNPLKNRPARIFGETLEGHLFAGANTGTLNWLIEDFGLRQLYEVKEKEFFPFGGKYVHAPIIAKMASGLDYNEFGDQRQPSFLADFKIENGKTIVPLGFAARESYFVVFRKKANDNSTKQLNFVPKKTIGKLSGSWTVYFDKKWGAPDSVEFLTLEDWTKRPETGIKFYSGTARYLKSFDAPAYKEGTSVYLNLGIFKSLAVVKLNGHSLGLVWAEPHIVDISKFLIAKNNVLEIEVTNTWNNRIIGDATLTAENRLTYTTYSSPKNAPLMPSGLIGPVVFQIDDPELHVPNK